MDDFYTTTKPEYVPPPLTAESLLKMWKDLATPSPELVRFEENIGLREMLADGAKLEDLVLFVPDTEEFQQGGDTVWTTKGHLKLQRTEHLDGLGKVFLANMNPPGLKFPWEARE